MPELSSIEPRLLVGPLKQDATSEQAAPLHPSSLLARCPKRFQPRRSKKRLADKRFGRVMWAWRSGFRIPALCLGSRICDLSAHGVELSSALHQHPGCGPLMSPEGRTKAMYQATSVSAMRESRSIGSKKGRMNAKSPWRVEVKGFVVLGGPQC